MATEQATGREGDFWHRKISRRGLFGLAGQVTTAVVAVCTRPTSEPSAADSGPTSAPAGSAPTRDPAPT